MATSGTTGCKLEDSQKEFKLDPYASYYFLVGTAGFEPTTPTPPVWCATWLRYAPIFSYVTERTGIIPEKIAFASKHSTVLLQDFLAEKPLKIINNF